MEILLLKNRISDFQFKLNGFIDLPFSGNPWTTWVEHNSPNLGMCGKTTCSFEPFDSLWDCSVARK